MLKSGKGCGIYRETLNREARDRYVEKLSIIRDLDPYEVPNKEWSTDNDLLPPFCFPDLVTYLVCGVSAYTPAQFKSHKSWESHRKFTNGWVQELQIIKPENCDSTVIRTKVLHSRRIRETPLQPWVIIASDGSVSCAHCTCMAGIAECCTHVEALLFKLEATIRNRGDKTATDVAANNIPSSINKVHSEVGHKMDFTSPKAQRVSVDRPINDNAPMPGLRTNTCRRMPKSTLDGLSSLLPLLHKNRAVCMSTMEGYYQDYADPVESAPVDPIF